MFKKTNMKIENLSKRIESLEKAEKHSSHTTQTLLQACNKNIQVLHDHTVNLEKSVNNKIDDLKHDIATSLGFIIEHMSNCVDKNSINEINSKLDSLFNENEIIRRQLNIEEDLRNIEDEISSLKKCFQDAIEDLNDTLANMWNIWNFGNHV